MLKLCWGIRFLFLCSGQMYKLFCWNISAQFGTTDEDLKSPNLQNNPSVEVESKYKELVVTLENGVLTIKMNRPTKYNAITWEVHLILFIPFFFNLYLLAVCKQAGPV